MRKKLSLPLTVLSVVPSFLPCPSAPCGWVLNLNLFLSPTTPCGPEAHVPRVAMPSCLLPLASRRFAYPGRRCFPVSYPLRVGGSRTQGGDAFLSLTPCGPEARVPRTAMPSCLLPLAGRRLAYPGWRCLRVSYPLRAGGSRTQGGDAFVSLTPCEPEARVSRDSY